MNFTLIHPSGARALALVLALALAGCGGGGGNPGAVGGSGSTGSTGGAGGTGGTGGTTVPAAPTVTLAFATTGGQASSTLSASSPLIASATVKDKDGKPVQGALVAFSGDSSLVLFSPSAGTALTNANGVASVTLRPASLAAGGAGKITVSTSVAGTTVSGEANVSVGATALSLSPLKLEATQVDAYGSTVVSVDVLANGAAYTDQQLTVNFSSTCVDAGKATLAPAVRTVNGTAKAVYRDLGCGTTDLVSASTDGVAKPASASLQIAPPSAASVQFVSASPVGQSLVIKGQGGIGRTETATLTFKVVDVFAHPLAGKNVTFSVFPANVTLNKASDTTDQNGQVITTVNSGDVATTFRVKATLDGGISTYSDTIVVTSGLPTQAAMSLSSNVTAVDGSYDDMNAATFNIMLADKFGNPVADGTPVVFQTNLGAIGSSSSGGCVTTNGACSAIFRTQNPRVAAPNTPLTPCNNPYGVGTSNDSTRPGLATICASTTDGTTTLFTKSTLFFSGGVADHVYRTDTGTQLTMDPANPNDLGSIQFQQPRVFTLQVNDQFLNPMPTDTTVAVNDLINAVVRGVQPAKVGIVFPHTAAGDDATGNSVSTTDRQGSFHTISMASSIAEPCTADRVATFNVVITTPNGHVTSYPFKVKFTCS
jgi:hypothetical protein